MRSQVRKDTPFTIDYYEGEHCVLVHYVNGGYDVVDTHKTLEKAETHLTELNSKEVTWGK